MFLGYLQFPKAEMAFVADGHYNPVFWQGAFIGDPWPVLPLSQPSPHSVPIPQTELSLRVQIRAQAWLDTWTLPRQLPFFSLGCHATILCVFWELHTGPSP